MSGLVKVFIDFWYKVMKVKSKQEPEGDVFLDLCHLRDKTPVCHWVPVIKSLTVVNLDPKF